MEQEDRGSAIFQKKTKRSMREFEVADYVGSEEAAILVKEITSIEDKLV